jgi:WD40 repeat protein
LLHEEGLGGVAFSPDGLHVVTSSHDGSGRIPRYTAQVLAGHTAAVREVSFSPDGASVLTVSDDKTARIWDVATGKTVATLPADDDEIKSARFSADGIGC